jgi:hypothetical protein
MHSFCACGKTVNSVCIPVNPFQYFSLAPTKAIRDNPARVSEHGAEIPQA